MAATAEALMNSLAGGSDASDSGDNSASGADSGGSSGAASSASDQDGASAHKQVQSVAAAGVDGENQQGQPPRPDPKAASQPGSNDQVANLNAAIRETRAENKTLKQQLAELTAKIDSLAKPPPAAAAEPEAPDFLSDPKAYVDDAKAKLVKLTEQIEADKAKQAEQETQRAAAQETWNKVIAAETEFAAATPDYHDALNHVRAIRTEQIKIEIRETEEREPTAEEIGRILSIQEAQGAAALIAKGKNPSKFYYEYAKTFGYKPKAAAEPATTATTTSKPDKEAVRTMGSGGASDSGGGDEPAGDSPLGGLLAAAQSEHRAQFRRKKS